jgi:hypothetical protein
MKSDRLFTLDTLFGMHKTQATTERARHRIDKLEPHVRHLAAAHIEASDIRESRLLTPEGKKDAAAKLAQRVHKETKELRAELERADDNMRTAARARVAAAQPAPLSESERLRKSLRHSITWQQVQGLSSAEIEAIYRNGNAETREALENAPQRVVSDPARGVFAHVEPMLRPEVVTEVHSGDLRAQHPEVAADLDDVEAVAQMSASILGVAEEAVRELSPDGTAEPAQFTTR